MSANVAYLMHMIERDSEAGNETGVSKARLQLVAEAFAAEKDTAAKASLVTLGAFLLFGPNVDLSVLENERDEEVEQQELVI